MYDVTKPPHVSVSMLKTICFDKNTFGNMTTENKRLSYTIQSRLEVLNYAKMHGNRAVARHFG